MRLTLFIIAYIMASVAALPAAEWHVAPGGNDSNPGTEERPVQTPGRAQALARERIAEGLDEDVMVWIHGGRYALTEPLRFGPADSGTARHAVTYAAIDGEPVSLSGGRVISGWTPADNGLWTASVPEVRRGEWRFRELFVNGRRAVRARSPFARLVKTKPDKASDTFSVTLPEGTLGNWKAVEDIEIIILGDWEIFRKRLARIDVEHETVVLAPPDITPYGSVFPRPGMPAYLENARELLDEPGEWYLDRRAGKLYYRPRQGETMDSATVIAPRLDRLMILKGTEDTPIQNLHFRGLTFEHAQWPLPEQGYSGAQACVRNLRDWSEIMKDWAPGSQRAMPSALSWEWTRECGFVDGQIARVGGGGLRLRRGCSENRIEGNWIHDIGGNGIMIGEIQWRFHYYRNPEYQAPDAEVPRGNVVANNLIEHCGRDYPGGVGIGLMFTQGTRVRHNLVRHLPYTGISIGWMWRAKPQTVCRDNVIEYNHIHDVMRLLADGGGIYTLGWQPGMMIRANRIHDVHYSDIAGQTIRSNNGMFFDQGSKGFHVENNMIHDTAGPPLRFNQNDRSWHAWKDNLVDKPAPKPDFPAARAGLEPRYQKTLGATHK